VGLELTTLVVIGTDCKGNCKSNWHTIMTMTALQSLYKINVMHIVESGFKHHKPNPYPISIAEILNNCNDLSFQEFN
jgi:hypothetical protein